MSFIYWIFFRSKVLVVEKEGPKQYIVALGRKDLSEDAVLKAFSRNSVLGVSDSSYRLKLNEAQYNQFKNLNLSHTVLPDVFLIDKNGMAIWKVKFYQPVYPTKVQLIANYGRIIKEEIDNEQSVLIWTNQEGAQKISDLDIVSSVTGYTADERVAVDLGSKLTADPINIKLNILIIDNNLESIKKQIISFGSKIIEDDGSILIDASLSSVVLNVETDYKGLENLLVSFPQLIYVY
jgi:hypothetical protein